MKEIPFNKPYLCGDETAYISDAVARGQLSGNGYYTKKCHSFFEEKYGFEKCLLTHSGTDALEMAAILADIEPGDEVIMPSYTFVSTANAFVLRGAKIVFADCRPDHPGMDEQSIEKLITAHTKAIVPVHYAGVACDMERIMNIASRHNLFVIEDAAHAIDSYYTFSNGVRKPLGSIGHMGAFSFHETKNIISGEGGMLTVNDARLLERSEIVWEKGTDRSAFFRGEVDKYGWKDLGSSFLPSEITAAFLWAQLENLKKIQERRKQIWNFYFNKLQNWAGENQVQLPFVPSYAENNAHLFYMVMKSKGRRNIHIKALGKDRILSIFHYQSLHSSSFYKDKHDGRELPMADRYSNCLVRLPFYFELSGKEQMTIINATIQK